jgi:nucleoside-diphosphate-sugar epimerase
VHDTVRGFVAVAECDAAIGHVFNVGSNYEISVGDTARLIAELMGREVEFITDEQRMRPAGSEVERLWADNSKARDLAGWTPEYPGVEGLRRGLQETIAWFGERDNLRRYKAGAYNI